MAKFVRKPADLDEFQYGDHDVVCHCGLKASRRISHTAANPGRKFFGCRNYKSKVTQILVDCASKVQITIVMLIVELWCVPLSCSSLITFACFSYSTVFDEYTVFQNASFDSALKCFSFQFANTWRAHFRCSALGRNCSRAWIKP
ncbi:hypothetical protein LINPERHAP2_LOCUS35380 [Linum perenne]